jgi:NAD-dependent deacetylase
MTKIDDVARLLAGRRRILVFTGAGISTESGIPDFRGPDGVWSRVDPDDFTISRYLADPMVRRRSWMRRAAAEFLDAHPNRGHFAITRLWESGVMVGCVTQNVDGLHSAAGLPGEALAELHGTAATTSCIDCGTTTGTREVMDRVGSGEDDPACRVCGGILKADMVFFGEALPARAMERALAWADVADAVIAVGTTLSVFPAAAIPIAVADRGHPFVIINRGPTDLDPIADLVVDDDAGDALSCLVTGLGLTS